MAPEDERRLLKAVSNRVLGGGVAAVLLIVFIVMNREQTQISFILFNARTPLWTALALAGVIGLVAGYLLGRKRPKQ